jgi:hypothetical protein
MTTVPDRLVLEGVPRVHFYEGGPSCPEDIPFPFVMRAGTGRSSWSRWPVRWITTSTTT